MVKLTDVCDIQYGYAFDSKCFTEDNSYMPLVRIRDIKRGFSETFYAGEYPEKYIVHVGDLLVGMDGEFNIAHWKSQKALLNQRVCKLVAREGTNEEYLRFAMTKSLKDIERKTAFVTVKHLSAKELNKLELNLPTIEEQNRIAKILSKLERVIDWREKELQYLENLIESRFIELFGTENELDKWPCCTIGEVADVCVGVVIKPTQYYADKGIPAFRSLNIGKMQVKDNDWVYFTEEGHQKNQKSIIHKNDVLVVRSGAPGTACVATEKYDGYNAIDIIIAHPDSSKVNPVFLAAFTNMPHGMNQIREKTSGAAQQHFNVGGYKTMCLIMPSMELQNQFAAFVEQTNKSKFKEIQFLKTTHILLKQCFFEKQSQQNRQKLQGGT
jgi:type I restriction enzyme S subunit